MVMLVLAVCNISIMADGVPNAPMSCTWDVCALYLFHFHIIFTRMSGLFDAGECVVEYARHAAVGDAA